MIWNSLMKRAMIKQPSKQQLAETVLLYNSGCSGSLLNTMLKKFVQQTTVS